MGLDTGETITQADFIQAADKSGTPGANENLVPKLESNDRLSHVFVPKVGARAKRSSTASCNATFSAVDLNAEDFDTDSFHDNSTNPSRMTIPTGQDGIYLIGCAAALTTIDPVAVRIVLNGSTILTVAQADGFQDSGISAQTVYELAASDYIEMHVATPTTKTLLGDQSVNLWLTRLY